MNYQELPGRDHKLPWNQELEPLNTIKHMNYQELPGRDHKLPWNQELEPLNTIKHMGTP